MDISYCETAQRSLAYGDLQKHRTINRAGLDGGHGGPDGGFDFVFGTEQYYDKSNAATDEELLEIDKQARASRTTSQIFKEDARSAVRPAAAL